MALFWNWQTAVLFLMERTVTVAHFRTSHCIYMAMFLLINLYYYDTLWSSVFCLLAGSDNFNKKKEKASQSFTKKKQYLYFERIEKTFHAFQEKQKKKPYWKVNHYQISVLCSVSVIINFIQRPLLYVFSTSLLFGIRTFFVWHLVSVHFFLHFGSWFFCFPQW